MKVRSWKLAQMSWRIEVGGWRLKRIIAILCLSSILQPPASIFLHAAEFHRVSYLHYLRHLLHQRSGNPSGAMTELILAYQSNPGAGELLKEIVALALDLKQLEIAEIYSRRAVDAAPDSPDSLLLRAQVLAAQGRTPEAKALLDLAHKTDPAHPGVLLELAAFYADSGNKKEASRTMDLYLKVASGSLELLKFKANFELQDKNPKALKSWRDAFEADPEDPETLDGLVASYQLFSSSQALTGVLREALEKNPDHAQLAVALCQLYGDAGQRRDCFEESLKSRPYNAKAVLGLAETYEREERWEEALDVIRERREVFGKDPAPGLKESFYLLQMDRSEEALAVLEREAALYPHNDSVSYFLALGYQDLGRWKEAAVYLERIFNRWPHWKEPAYNYALACGELGELALMEKVLVQLWKEYPNDSVILNALGYTWAELGKNLSEARGLIEKALQAEPDNFSYQDSLGWALFKTGQIQKAYEILAPVVSKTQDAEVLLHFTQVLAKLDRHAEAWEAYFAARLSGKKVAGSQRLLAQSQAVEKFLNKRFRPKSRDVLAKDFPVLGEFRSGFRCDWEVAGGEKFRTRMLIRREPAEEKASLTILPPASVPLTIGELSGMFPKAGGALQELEGIVDGFYQGDWAFRAASPSARFWKVREDFSVSFQGKRASAVFLDFQRLKGAGLLPGRIEIKSQAFGGVCRLIE